MKGFAIHNAPTDHGGIIPATQMRSSQMGNIFVVAGDGHFCPKCKCWSTVVKSHDHVIFDGKAVAYAGDLLSCGARILPQQSHVVGDSGSYYGAFSENNTVSSVTDDAENNWINYKFNDGFDYRGMSCTLFFKSGEKLVSTVNENNILEFKGFSNDDFDYLHFTELQGLNDDTCFSDYLLKKI